jgi:hypothetical protein
MKQERDMIPLPIPDPQKEHAYVGAKVQSRYWNLPRNLPWILFPILGGVTFLTTFDELRFPLPILATAAAALSGLLIARWLATKIPTWNQSRRENIRKRAQDEFIGQFRALENEFQGVVAEVERFRKVVKGKSYRLYVERARAAERCMRFPPAKVDLFFDEMPGAVAELRDSMEVLVNEVEGDPAAVTAYQPDLISRVNSFGKRVAAGNVIDCYRASRELEELLDALEKRHSPFAFTEIISQLREQVQQCRDEILSDPKREAVWRDIQYKDEALREQRRHNRAMEEAAEEEAEAARDQAEAALEQVTLARIRNEQQDEQNELLRKQVSAQQVTAVGTAATAFYTRKGANATREIADRPTTDN